MRTMIGPALLIGPLLGVLGGVAFFLLALTDSGSGGAGAGGVAMLMVIFGSVLGLFIATPLAVVAGAAMLRMSANGSRWAMRRAWACAGLIIGGVTGAFVGSLTGDADGFLGIFSVLAMLGTVGALISRRMLSTKIDALNAIDSDIFA